MGCTRGMGHPSHYGKGVNLKSHKIAMNGLMTIPHWYTIHPGHDNQRTHNTLHGSAWQFVGTFKARWTSKECDTSASPGTSCSMLLHGPSEKNHENQDLELRWAKMMLRCRIRKCSLLICSSLLESLLDPTCQSWTSTLNLATSVTSDTKKCKGHKVQKVCQSK